MHTHARMHAQVRVSSTGQSVMGCAVCVQEIVGGMIDAEPGLWRKPHRESFEEQRRKVLEFEQWWKPFDITT